MFLLAHRSRHNSSSTDRQPESTEVEKEMFETGTETRETPPRVGPTLTQAEMEAVMKKAGPPLTGFLKWQSLLRPNKCITGQYYILPINYICPNKHTPLFLFKYISG